MDTKLKQKKFVQAICYLAVVVLTVALTGNAVAQDEPPPTVWRDEFDGSLAADWGWMNENPDQWNLTETPGFLRIYTSDSATGSENLLLRPVAAGDFSIETRLFFTPERNYQIAGLVIWQDAENFLQLGRAFCDNPDGCVGNGIYFDYIQAGGWAGGNFATQMDNPFDPAEAYLRLERRGEMVRALYSHEGITWIEIGTHWIPPDFQVNGVGLTAAQGANIPADFDYFELTEGWGFLPEGFHDYDGGDVPAWACNAGGWAADPDDRAVDLAIEIDFDGVPLPDWLSAGEYREDLDSAGVCSDGNCGFSTSLWGTLSAYEPHEIVAYAQDIPSGDWVQLTNSPKALTCRTYDIYAYDPLTGVTRLITTTLDTVDEYNPSWSPNGKKVAHDVVHGDGQVGIYITDVKTGLSVPLAGAQEGGNDAVFSPNGKWIAFDRAWTDTPNLYIVPATGGVSSRVRAAAVSADWAPNGRRLVFQGLDGSIGTVAIDGGNGGETVVVERGANPAWSPDGNWIAYDLDGDIWKVNVDLHGAVLGEPVQVTSGPFADAQPTWSPDSATIVYHTGFNDDWDLWSVPAAGGNSIWLTGAPNFGDYDPAEAKNSPSVAYASFSPAGQAARTWVAAFTYDAGTWDPTTEVPHTYQFWTEGLPSGDERSFYVSSAAPLYAGYVLIRPGALRAQTPDGCANIDELNPAQETRFSIGWTFDGLYADAGAFYENLNVQIRWDSWEPVGMVMHEIFPYTPPVDWFGYTCTFTQP